MRSFTNELGSEIVHLVCTRYSVKGLRLLLSRPIGTIDVEPRMPADIVSDRDLAILETVSKGLRGVARLNHDDIDRQRLWNRLRPMIESLHDGGWTSFAGRDSGIVAIVLAKSEAPIIEAAVEWECDPEMRAVRGVDDWTDGLSLLR